MHKRHPNEHPLLAVLIDADNLNARLAESILKEVSNIGEPALRRVYGDWTEPNLKHWSEKLLSLGLVAIQASANTKSKHASDIRLVIDAMDILHDGQFDGFVIVSSDSDFTALANRLREAGKLVICIGEEKTPTSLQNVVNRFILIENIDETARKDSPPAQHPKAALGLVKQAMAKIEPDDDWYALGLLGQTIRASHSDFDTRTYGCVNLSTLVQSVPKLEYRQLGSGWVRLKK
jgi:uncharacterized protein (TIGR00288 family)